MIDILAVVTMVAVVTGSTKSLSEEPHLVAPFLIAGVIGCVDGLNFERPAHGMLAGAMVCITVSLCLILLIRANM